MKKMSIYEPALCCETGICGVSIDPELIRISTTLNVLNKNGIKVERYNLNNAPIEFVRNQIINKFVNEKGVDDLPVVMLDGEIIITGRYPTKEEFIELLGIPASYLTEAGNKEDNVCCSGEDGCC